MTKVILSMFGREVKVLDIQHARMEVDIYVMRDYSFEPYEEEGQDRSSAIQRLRFTHRGESRPCECEEIILPIYEFSEVVE